MQKTFFEIFKMKLHETLLLLNKNKKFVLKMQNLRTAKRSMRTRPGSDFAWSFYTAKLHIFSFFLKNCRIIRSILKQHELLGLSSCKVYLYRGQIAYML